MNNVSPTGRLTREPELRYGGQDNSTAITRFTLAVDDGKDTDFINIKCFGRTAEWAQKWLSKGSRAEVTGKIKTGSYESQRTGSKVYYTEVVANSVGFGESKAEAEARGQPVWAFGKYWVNKSISVSKTNYNLTIYGNYCTITAIGGGYAEIGRASCRERV